MIQTWQPPQTLRTDVSWDQGGRLWFPHSSSLSCSVSRNSILGLLEFLRPALMDSVWSQEWSPGDPPGRGPVGGDGQGQAHQGTSKLRAAITYSPTGNTKPDLNFQR